MIVHVANFSSQLPGRKVCIANSVPNGVKMRTLKRVFPTLAQFIIPSWGLVKGFKDGKITWEVYTRIYLEQLQNVNLGKALEKLGTLLEADQIVLCCWEGKDDPHCHRKLLYDLIPEDMRGERE